MDHEFQIPINSSQQKSLKGLKIAYFSLDNGVINLHGFDNITSETKVAFFTLEDDSALVIVPDDSLADGDFLQFDRYVCADDTLIRFLHMHNAFYTLFVRVDYRWVQINGVKFTEISSKDKANSPKMAPGTGTVYN